MSELPPTDWFSDAMRQRTARRYRRDRIFRGVGLAGIVLALGMLAVLLVGIASSGYQGFRQTQIYLSVELDVSAFRSITAEDVANDTVDVEKIRKGPYGKLVRESLMAMFPDVSGRSNIRELNKLVSVGAKNQLRQMLMADSSLLGQRVELWVPSGADVDGLVKEGLQTDVPEADRRLSDQQVEWVRQLDERGLLQTVLSDDFISAGDSREPELAGIWGAVVGSALTLLVTLIVSMPLGVAAAIYLEEFAKKGRLSDWIEVNINNLAAVPSIVYGLLGLAIFLNFFEMPICTCGWRADIGHDDTADDNHCRSCCIGCCAALYPRCGNRTWCLQNAGDLPPHLTIGDARYSDRQYYWYGPCTG